MHGLHFSCILLPKSACSHDRSSNPACAISKHHEGVLHSGSESVLVLHAAVQQIPPQISMAAAREEAEMVLFDSVRHVLDAAHLKPGQVSFPEPFHKCITRLWSCQHFVRKSLCCAVAPGLCSCSMRQLHTALSTACYSDCEFHPKMCHDWHLFVLQIDILVVNCSLFNPTPSLSAMIINHFKMRSNVVSYNLAGMGCSAGVIAINLAKELLQVQCQHSWHHWLLVFDLLSVSYVKCLDGMMAAEYSVFSTDTLVHDCKTRYSTHIQFKQL